MFCQQFLLHSISKQKSIRLSYRDHTRIVTSLTFTPRILHPQYQITQHSRAMDEATKERLRLNALHDEELLRIGKTQEQQREHIAQIQAQERDHHKLILDIEHQAVHEASIIRQEALDEQHYKHRKRILKLERQSASTERAIEPSESVSESDSTGSRNKSVVASKEPVFKSEHMESRNEAVVEREERVTKPEIAGSANEDSGDRTSRGSRLKAGQILKFVASAEKRAVEKRR